jgi:hypothetical protein
MLLRKLYPDIEDHSDYEEFLKDYIEQRTMLCLCRSCYLHYATPLTQLTLPKRNIRIRKHSIDDSFSFSEI